MTTIRFIPLGVGDAFSRRFYSFCVAVEHDGCWLLVDCPHPIRKMMAEAREKSGVDLDVKDIEAVVLTHLHADHSSGLEGFGFYARGALGKKTRVAAHPTVLQNLWSGRLAVGMGLSRPRPGAELEERTFEDFFLATALDFDAPVSVGPFSVECRPTVHHLPTTALRISAGGKTLSISSDTTFDEDLIEWLSQGDIVLHETGPGMHAPYEKLLALPAKIRDKIRIIHCSDEFRDTNPRIELIEQGKIFEL